MFEALVRFLRSPNAGVPRLVPWTIRLLSQILLRARSGWTSGSEVCEPATRRLVQDLLRAVYVAWKAAREAVRAAVEAEAAAYKYKTETHAVETSEEKVR